MEFHFVNSSQPGDELSVENRTQIRSCAALSGYKSMFETVPCGKKWRSRRGLKSVKSQSTLAADAKSKPKPNPQYTMENQCSQFTVANPVQQDASPVVVRSPPELSPGKMFLLTTDKYGFRQDPFWTFPCPKLSYMNYVFDHYITYMTPTLAALDVTQAIGRLQTLNNSMDEPALFYALTAFAAAHLASRGGTDVNHTDILWLKWKAITSINEALADPVRATSDLVIYAVFKMATFERIYGDMDSHHAHIKGAQKMVALRGGLQNLEPVNSNALRFEDRVSRMLSGSPLYFPDELSGEVKSVERKVKIKEEVISLPTPPDSPPLSVLPTGFSKMCLTSEMLVILPHLLTAIDQLRGHAPSRASTDIIRHMREELGIVEAHVLASAPTFNKRIMQKQHTSSEVIVQCVRLATLSLAYYIFANYDPSAPTFFQQHERMARATLKLCIDPYTIYEHTDGVTWALFMVGMAVTGSTRMRAKMALARMHQHQALPSWHQTRSMLEKFLYLPDVCDAPCMELWQQAVSLSPDNAEGAQVGEAGNENVWVSWVPVISSDFKGLWKTTKG